MIMRVPELKDDLGKAINRGSHDLPPTSTHSPAVRAISVRQRRVVSVAATVVTVVTTMVAAAWGDHEREFECDHCDFRLCRYDRGERGGRSRCDASSDHGWNAKLAYRIRFLGVGWHRRTHGRLATDLMIKGLQHHWKASDPAPA